MSKIPSDDILESLYKVKIRESSQLKTVLELYDMEIHQKILMPSYQKLKTMVKRSTDQKLRLRNFEARHRRIETGAVVKSRKGLGGVEGRKGICYLWKEKGQCSKGDQCSFRHESNDRAQKPEHTAATLSEPSMSRGRITATEHDRSERRADVGLKPMERRPHRSEWCTRDYGTSASHRKAGTRTPKQQRLHPHVACGEREKLC